MHWWPYDLIHWDWYCANILIEGTGNIDASSRGFSFKTLLPCENSFRENKLTFQLWLLSSYIVGWVLTWKSSQWSLSITIVTFLAGLHWVDQHWWTQMLQLLLVILLLLPILQLTNTATSTNTLYSILFLRAKVAMISMQSCGDWAGTLHTCQFLRYEERGKFIWFLHRE